MAEEPLNCDTRNHLFTAYTVPNTSDDLHRWKPFIMTLINTFEVHLLGEHPHPTTRQEFKGWRFGTRREQTGGAVTHAQQVHC